jgi:hypothetical protein
MSLAKTENPDVEAFHWDRLSSLHPTDVCNRTEAIYNPTREGFVLPVYHLRYMILPKERKILRIRPDDQLEEESLHPFFVLFVLVYLVEAKDLKLTYTWISEKDLKGGSTFFRGPHRLQVEELEALYGNNPQGLLEAGRRLGGSEILYGDKAFALSVLPRVPVAYVLWKGDPEFPPRISMLFDSTVQAHLPLDIIWCMVAETTRRLVEVSRP